SLLPRHYSLPFFVFPFFLHVALPVCLIPAFFLVKLWGGPQRHAAATQFFVYTMAGSIAMLLGFLALHSLTKSFDFIALAQFRERLEEHTSELSHVAISYAVFCLKKKK